MMQRSSTETIKGSLHQQQWAAFMAIVKKLNRSERPNDVLTDVLQIIHRQLHLLHGMLALYDSEQDTLKIRAIFTDGMRVAEPIEQVRYRPGEGIVGTVFKSGQTVVIGQLLMERRYLGRLALYDYELPLVAVPIHGYNGDISGVLMCQPEQTLDDGFEEQLSFLETLSEQLGLALRLTQSNPDEHTTLLDERDQLRQQVRGTYGFDNMVGRTASMRQVFELVRQVAKWETTVLIRGESGTGKELIANAIHYNSPRSNAPFIKLNCAALPENLLESELFGHEKGAFTGAVRARKGRFEQAHGGTLFLDEIGEISATFQAKLLRVLQEGELERVGGTGTIKVNVRVLAATNRPLEEEVRQGRFREDLYYRLNVMPIPLPPLRERKEDIPYLSEFLLDKLARTQHRQLSLDEGAIRALVIHDWPGNVRELENRLERAAILSENGTINAALIAMTGLDAQPLHPQANNAPAIPVMNAPQVRPSSPMASQPSGADQISDKERVIAALEQAGWVQAKAARLLGMTPRQIAYRIKIYDIPVRRL